MNVEELIIETFKKAVNMIEENKKYTSLSGKPKIIYPCYSQELGSGETRISEQEIKQIFIQTLNEDSGKNFYFSVEAPTELKYKFSENRKLIDPLVGDGESANIDLCLYKFEDSKFKRKHLIEFKFKNSAEHEIKKDFLKLFVEESKQGQQDNYFIHILDSANSGTLCKATELPPPEVKRTSVLQKYYNSWKHCIKQEEYCKVGNIKSKNKITIYLLIINNKEYSSDCYKIELLPDPSLSIKVFDPKYYEEPSDPNQHNESLHFLKFKQKN